MKTDIFEKYKDLVGKPIPGSKLRLKEILNETATDGSYSRMCLAECECGNVIKRKLIHILSGHNKSCGKCGYKSSRISETHVKDLTGQRFGYLEVIRPSNKRRNETKNSGKSVFWICKCTYNNCGNTTEVRSDLLQSGRVKTCGRCGFVQDRLHELNTIYDTPEKHALARKFSKMYDRCYNKNFKEYANYGGKGVVICDEWLSDRMKFVEWGLQNGFKLGLTIERKNEGEYHEKKQNGPYSPWNCKFATMKEQGNNKTSNRWISTPTRELTFSQCRDILGMSYHMMRRIGDEEISNKVALALTASEFLSSLK